MNSNNNNNNNFNFNFSQRNRISNKRQNIVNNIFVLNGNEEEIAKHIIEMIGTNQAVIGSTDRRTTMQSNRRGYDNHPLVSINHLAANRQMNNSSNRVDNRSFGGNLMSHHLMAANQSPFRRRITVQNQRQDNRLMTNPLSQRISYFEAIRQNLDKKSTKFENKTFELNRSEDTTNLRTDQRNPFHWINKTDSESDESIFGKIFAEMEENKTLSKNEIKSDYKTDDEMIGDYVGTSDGSVKHYLNQDSTSNVFQNNLRSDVNQNKRNVNQWTPFMQRAEDPNEREPFVGRNKMLKDMSSFSTDNKFKESFAKYLVNKENAQNVSSNLREKQSLGSQQIMTSNKLKFGFSETNNDFKSLPMKSCATQTLQSSAGLSQRPESGKQLFESKLRQDLNIPSNFQWLAKRPKLDELQTKRWIVSSTKKEVSVKLLPTATPTPSPDIQKLYSKYFPKK